MSISKISCKWLGFRGDFRDWFSSRHCDPFSKDSYMSYRLGPLAILVW